MHENQNCTKHTPHTHTHTHWHMHIEKGTTSFQINDKHCDISDVFMAGPLHVAPLNNVFTVNLICCILNLKKKKVLSVYIYRFVWHGRPLTDVCWFEAMVNVPVKRAALCLIIRAHASVIGRWEAHEACVCSGKLLNCFCVYTKDYATKNIILSPRLRAQRIWSSADDRGEPFEKSAATNSRPNLSPR